MNSHREAIVDWLREAIALAEAREEVLDKVKTALREACAARKMAEAGYQPLFPATERDPPSHDLFATGPDGVSDEDILKVDMMLMREIESLGFPLSGDHSLLYPWAGMGVAEAAKLPGGSEARVIGVVADVKKKTARPDPSRKSSRSYARFSVSGNGESLDCIMWPEAFAATGKAVEEGSLVVLEGFLKCGKSYTDEGDQVPNSVKTFQVRSATAVDRVQAAVKSKNYFLGGQP